jgi:hypothetical protein
MFWKLRLPPKLVSEALVKPQYTKNRLLRQGRNSTNRFLDIPAIPRHYNARNAKTKKAPEAVSGALSERSLL